MATAKTPIIFDTDPGVDDSLAIMIAASRPNIDLLALTSVHGNVDCEKTTNNALMLRDFLGLDCDVAKGASEPLGRKRPPAPDDYKFHGVGGLGNATLPPARRALHELPASEYIYQKAKELGGALEIVAVGPLTNLALMLRDHPDAKDLIKRILIMGGSTKQPGEGVRIGNVTEFAEVNIWADDLAASEVFKSGIPIVMAGLNVTEPTGIAFSFLKELFSSNTALCDAVFKMTDGYRSQGPNKDGEFASIIHDAVPVAYLTDPESCATERCHIDVALDELHNGQTVASYDDPATFNCTNITDMDMRRYEQLYRDAYARFDPLFKS